MTGGVSYDTPWRGRDGLVHLTYDAGDADERYTAMTICSFRTRVDGALAPGATPSCIWCITGTKAKHR